MLLTRSLLKYKEQALHISAQLACVRHAASVRPEPGSNSYPSHYSKLTLTSLLPIQLSMIYSHPQLAPQSLLSIASPTNSPILSNPYPLCQYLLSFFSYFLFLIIYYSKYFFYMVIYVNIYFLIIFILISIIAYLLQKIQTHPL